ncbi:MAG: hypothetical protein OEY49_16405 [Candidatus Heimdallarchaeota archaeon]|nr:hypothetical protein [Candidatus Heimdallarchaeota archaeon]
MTHIDNKISISGDAAEYLANFLDNYNSKLVKAKVVDAYSVVADIEKVLITEINNLGKTTKPTLDDVKEIVRKYGSITRIERQTTKLENGKHNKAEINKISRGYFKSLLIYLILFAPVIILIAVINNSISIGYKYHFDRYDFYILCLYSFIYYSILEFYSGITGKLYVSKQTMLKYRRLMKHVVFVLTLLAILIEITFPSYNIIYDDLFYYSYPITTTITDTSLIIRWISTYLIFELILFIRDNTKGLYPLDDKVSFGIYKLHPSYLLLIIAQLLYFSQDMLCYPFIILSLLLSIKSKIKFGFQYYFWNIALAVFIMMGSHEIIFQLLTSIVLLIVSVEFSVQRKNLSKSKFDDLKIPRRSAI